MNDMSEVRNWWEFGYRIKSGAFTGVEMWQSAPSPDGAEIDGLPDAGIPAIRLFSGSEAEAIGWALRDAGVDADVICVEVHQSRGDVTTLNQGAE